MRDKIFEPVIKDVLCLVEEQIRMGGPITAVILVGGFGQSQYLRDRLRSAVEKGVRVMQPDEGWVAVVKGAAIHGLSQVTPVGDSIVSRVSRRSYGTCLMTKYDKAKHNPREA